MHVAVSTWASIKRVLVLIADRARVVRSSRPSHWRTRGRRGELGVLTSPFRACRSPEASAVHSHRTDGVSAVLFSGECDTRPVCLGVLSRCVCWGGAMAFGISLVHQSRLPPSPFRQARRAVAHLLGKTKPLIAKTYRHSRLHAFLAEVTR